MPLARLGIATGAILLLVAAAPTVDPQTAAAEALSNSQYAKALRLCNDALKRETQVPARAKLLVLKGQAQFGLKRMPDAKASFRSALEADPTLRLQLGAPTAVAKLFDEELQRLPSTVV